MKLEIKDIYKSFGEKKVLEGINISASGGKAIGLLGRNGAGKTTTVRIIMGVFPADSGQVLLDSRPIKRDEVSIGYMPEEHGLYPKIEILEQLVYLGELRGISAKTARASATKWLERINMEEYMKKRLDTLSKGNQQKIQLAATLIANPDIVILDEPFSGLDPVNASLLKDVVKELIAQEKVVLFSSHQMNYVEEFCNDVAILNKGKIALSGAIKDIKRSYERNIITVQSTQSGVISDFCLNELKDMAQDVKPCEGGINITLKNAGLKSEFMGILAGKNFDIDAFSVYEPSLSDIFVQYTGGEDKNQERGKAS